MKLNILFVCLGNICRSPLAQGVMESIVNQEGLENELSFNGKNQRLSIFNVFSNKR